MTWNGVDLSPLLTGLATIVTALIGWLATSIKKKQDAATQQSRAETALLKLSAIAVGMAGRAWDALSPGIQQALADGKLDAAERLEIEAKVSALLKDFASDDDLAQIASAIGLPLPGVIAKIASMLIERYAFAHDASTPSQSRLAYPVGQQDLSGAGYEAG